MKMLVLLLATLLSPCQAGINKECGSNGIYFENKLQEDKNVQIEVSVPAFVVPPGQDRSAPEGIPPCDVKIFYRQADKKNRDEVFQPAIFKMDPGSCASKVMTIEGKADNEEGKPGGRIRWVCEDGFIGSRCIFDIKITVLN